MNATLKDNRGKKSEFAKQALIRYIQDVRLPVGAKLPGTDILRKQLNLSGTTIFRAIQSLRAEGVLEVRDKVGSFIKSANVATRIGRSIGVLLPDRDYPSAFFCMLNLYIQYALIQQGCLPVPFLRREVDQWQPSRLDDIPGLRIALEGEKLDGIIDLCDITLKSDEQCFAHIPIITVGTPSFSNNGVVVDLPGYLTAAMGRARRIGFLHPAMIISHSEYSERILKVAFRRLMTENGFSGMADEYIFEASAILEGRSLLARLLALPLHARPDVLILMDEYIGNDFLTALRLSADASLADYQPTVIACLNREQPVTLAAKRLICYRKSLRELAQRATCRLLQQLRGEAGLPRMEYLPFEEMPCLDFFNQNPTVAASGQSDTIFSQLFNSAGNSTSPEDL